MNRMQEISGQFSERKCSREHAGDCARSPIDTDTQLAADWLVQIAELKQDCLLDGSVSYASVFTRFLVRESFPARNRAYLFLILVPEIFLI